MNINTFLKYVDAGAINRQNFQDIVYSGGITVSLFRVTFKNCDFEGVEFRFPDADYVTFDGCNLNGATIEAQARSVEFTECEMASATLLLTGYSDDVVINDCNLTSATVKGRANHLVIRGTKTKANFAILSGTFHNSVFSTISTMPFVNGCDLTNARFYKCSLAASFKDVNLTGAQFDKCVTHGPTLATFNRCNLTGVNLYRAFGTRHDTSQSIGVFSANDWMKQNFAFVKNGGYCLPWYGPHWLVWKVIRASTPYAHMWPWPSPHYKLVLTENVNSSTSLECATGIHFGTLEWLRANYGVGQAIDGLWAAMIHAEDGPGIVVPDYSNGKARCARMELLCMVPYFDALEIDKLSKLTRYSAAERLLEPYIMWGSNNV